MMIMSEGQRARREREIERTVDVKNKFGFRLSISIQMKTNGCSDKRKMILFRLDFIVIRDGTQFQKSIFYLPALFNFSRCNQYACESFLVAVDEMTGNFFVFFRP